MPFVWVKKILSTEPCHGEYAQRARRRSETALTYERWLRDTMAQTAHEQTYPWGSVRLLYARHDRYHLRIDYSDSLLTS